jgi:hypothetical protein
MTLVALLVALLGFPQAPVPVAVTGLVQDQTGAVLAAATVELVNASGAVVQTTAADAAGLFRFDGVAPGQYELRARYEGFKSATAKLRVGTRAPSSQRLVLPLGDLTQEITVSNAAAEVGASSNSNVDAINIDQDMLGRCRSSTTTSSRRCRSFSTPDRSATAASRSSSTAWKSARSTSARRRCSRSASIRIRIGRILAARARARRDP